MTRDERRKIYMAVMDCARAVDEALETGDITEAEGKDLELMNSRLLGVQSIAVRLLRRKE